MLASAASWTNEPAAVEAVVESGASVVRVRTRPGTDFWERTHYGFQRDSGHWCGAKAPLGDWECRVHLAGAYRRAVQYDQAGLMVRPAAAAAAAAALCAEDPARRQWVKAGIECVDGAQQASVVVTRDGLSDWSTTPLSEAEAAGGIWLRLQRRGDALFVHWRPSAGSAAEGAAEGRYSAGGWRMLRLAAVPLDWGPLLVGPMACSPDEQPGGFTVDFAHFHVSAIAPDVAPQAEADAVAAASSASAATASDAGASSLPCV
jgi:regulation of enolase protein 1 (concanavalin A-like superfamily)